MGPSYERAATVGFRCAYDWMEAPPPSPPPPTQEDVSSGSFFGSFFFYIFWMGLVGVGIFLGLVYLHGLIEAHLAQCNRRNRRHAHRPE